MVSLKLGHMDWVRDFDLKLNLFSLLPPSPPPNYYLFLRWTPYRSLSSYPRNRPLVNSWEHQSLAAATVPQKFGHCTCSELKYVECTKYVRVQAWRRACEQSVYVVCVPSWYIKWVVIVMVMCYCYGDVLLLWWCVTVMVMCYLHPYQTSTRTGAQLTYVHQKIFQSALQEQDGRVLQHVICNGDRFYWYLFLFIFRNITLNHFCTP